MGEPLDEGMKWKEQFTIIRTKNFANVDSLVPKCARECEVGNEISQ